MPFSPLDIAWHTMFWTGGPEFVALGLADGAAVTTWPDESSTHDATQSTASKKPTYRASVAGLNNKPAVEGDGTADRLVTAAFTAVAQPVTLVAVCRLTSSAVTSEKYMVATRGSGAAGPSLILRDDVGTDRWDYFAGTHQMAGLADTTAHLHVGVFNGASSSYELDGAVISTANPGARPSDMMGLFAPANTDAVWAPVQIAFAALKAGTLTTTELSDLEVWVAAEYGVSVVGVVEAEAAAITIAGQAGVTAVGHAAEAAAVAVAGQDATGAIVVLDENRQAAAAVRLARLPWGRRFTALDPDGTIDELDRARLTGSYYEAEATVEPPAVPVTYILDAGPSTDDLLNMRGVWQRTDRVRWDLLDASLNLQGTIMPDADPVPDVALSTGTTVTRKLNNLLLPWDQQADIDAFNARIRPVYILQNGVEFPLGVFLFADASRMRHSLGLDLTGPLIDYSFVLDTKEGVSVAWPAGANVGAVLALEFEAAGVLEFRIDPTTVAIAEPGLGWGPNDTRLKRMTDLCRLAGFFAPYFDRHGVGVCRHAVEPGMGASNVISYTADRDTGRMYPNTIIESDDLLAAPNRWIVTSNSGTDAPVRGVHEIPADCPHSFARRGFYVTEPRSVQGITDSNRARAVAEAEATKAPVGHQYIEFDGIPDPRHDVYDVVTYLGMDFLELEWRLEIRPGGNHHHRLRRSYAGGGEHA